MSDQTSPVPFGEERFLKWMVDARGRIHAALLELLSLLRERRAEIDGILDRRLTVGLLASTGFALWRACFLIHHAGTGSKFLTDVDTFLVTVISDNAVSFRDDKNAWSCWHYLGIARSSLLEALSLLPSSSKMDQNTIRLVSQLDTGRFLILDAYEQWETLFRGFEQVQRALMGALDLPRTLHKLPTG
jgi:hypothetical protein